MSLLTVGTPRREKFDLFLRREPHALGGITDETVPLGFLKLKIIIFEFDGHDGGLLLSALPVQREW